MDTLQFMMPTVKRMITSYFKKPDISKLDSLQSDNYNHQLNLMRDNGMLEKMCLIICELGYGGYFVEKIEYYTGGAVFMISHAACGSVFAISASHDEVSCNVAFKTGYAKLVIRNADVFDIRLLWQLVNSVRSMTDLSNIQKIQDNCKDYPDVTFTSYKY